MSKGKIQELEQFLEEVKREKTKEKIDEMMKIMEQCELFLPAVLPPNTDPGFIKAMVDSKGKQVPIPKGVAPRPAVLENKEGQKFLPLFTSKEQAAKGSQKYPLTLGMPFQACMDLLAREKELTGIVINAFDQNIVLNMNVKKNQQPDRKEIKLTEAQMHAVIRQQVEAAVLPTAFFEQKGELVEEIKNEVGEVMTELYSEAYPEQIACPYTADEFEAMVLNIRDDLTVLRITMPDKKLVPGTCPMVLVSWNPVQEQIRYFGVVKGRGEEGAHIMEAFADGRKEDLGKAPEEGYELQYMIDLNDNEKNK